jgi:ribosomal subunit interface protein
MAAFPMSIQFHNIAPSPAIEEAIRAHFERLARCYGRIMEVKITLDARHRRHHQGTVYHLTVRLSVPGYDIVVSRDPERNHAHEDVYVAIRDAFRDARRQLQDYARRMRGDVKTRRGEKESNPRNTPG